MEHVTFYENLKTHKISSILKVLHTYQKKACIFLNIIKNIQFYDKLPNKYKI